MDDVKLRVKVIPKTFPNLNGRWIEINLPNHPPSKGAYDWLNNFVSDHLFIAKWEIVQ